MRADTDRSVPTVIHGLRLMLLAAGGFAVIWALLTFMFDALPGEWVTGAALLIFGTLTLVTGTQLAVGTKSRDIVTIEGIFMIALLAGGALLEQEWITPLFLVVPIVLFVVAYTGAGKGWFESGTVDTTAR